MNVTSISRNKVFAFWDIYIVLENILDAETAVDWFKQFCVKTLFNLNHDIDYWLRA